MVMASCNAFEANDLKLLPCCFLSWYSFHFLCSAALPMTNHRFSLPFNDCDRFLIISTFQSPRTLLEINNYDVRFFSSVNAKPFLSVYLLRHVCDGLSVVRKSRFCNVHSHSAMDLTCEGAVFLHRNRCILLFFILLCLMSSAVKKCNIYLVIQNKFHFYYTKMNKDSYHIINSFPTTTQ